jgi:hypothetical protein
MGIALGWIYFVRRRHGIAAEATDQYLQDHKTDMYTSDLSVAGGFKAKLAPLGSNPRAELHGEPATPPELPAVGDPKVPMELEGLDRKMPPVELEGSVVEKTRSRPLLISN